ncbi:MAG TPA: DUF4252 domain-containing protein [Thermodesulfovibrionales bacterium]|nr:DUF4252 domain-containing protein [Thermodesulfovibrionales bacterium]
MKKFFLIITALCMVSVLEAQTSAVDEMFNKYSEREGFTLISISSKMFSLLAGKGTNTSEDRSFINRLKSIRILSVEDSLLNENINFYDELSRKLNFGIYEELMVVREGKDMTKFLIRQNGDIISELLMITGGPGDNTLISIKGDLDLKTISDISKKSGIEELKTLDNIEKKNPRE